VHDSIREGESFAGPLRESKTCDAIVVNMIDVGEETGEMDAMLLKIADNYDEEVDVAVASVAREPARAADGRRARRHRRHDRRGDVPPAGRDDRIAGSPSEPLRAIGTRTSPWTYQSGLSGQPERDDDREYLQQDSGEDDYRFSNYSLAYYLIGALGKDIDGQEGPGSHKPLRDGSFDRMTNDTYPARYETKGGQLASKPWPSDGPQTYGRWEIQDRNGVAYRYYRWEPFPSDDSGYDDAHPLAELRVPRLFGDAAFDEDPDYSPAQERQEFRDAGYAIVAAGADGVFGDISDSYGYEEGVNEVYPTLESLSSVLEGLGRRFSGSDEEIKTQAENAARADNIVEVGR
jgi:hypothetical protein